MKKFGKNPLDQQRLERKRFEQRMKPKPVLAEQIKSREIRELKRRKERQETGQEKIIIEGLI